MYKLVSLATKVDKHVRHDDDMVDRMHHRYTVIILVSGKIGINANVIERVLPKYASLFSVDVCSPMRPM